jgi:hypothetical protein
MVSSAAAASSQRTRWEGGRRALTRAHAFRLLKRGLKEHNRVLLDLGLDLLVPPLSRLAIAAAAGSVVAGAAALALGGPVWLAAGVWTASAGSLAVYVLRGWNVSGTGLRGLLDLALAPVYVVWKITLGGTRDTRADAPWVRTKREAEGQSSS